MLTDSYIGVLAALISLSREYRRNYSGCCMWPFSELDTSLTEY